MYNLALRASPRVFKIHSQSLIFFGKIGKKKLHPPYLNSSLFTLRKIDPITWKDTRVSNRPIWRWGRIRKNDRVSNANMQTNTITTLV